MNRTLVFVGLMCLLLPARLAHALDPDKRLSQHLHRSWRTQDGSAPASMFTITPDLAWFSLVLGCSRHLSIRRDRLSLDLPALAA